ncbi:uncharacterized protein A4U43_C08F27830 [Asparagus officinalis]|uniref:pectinesterase-like n=1 Tax=Asparagus officinalis TaxID=4686 RepID=UPI00098E686F|nr:pectinesterase-like [Asparagus officinalis]ONK61257.1 uncharacterized protein A4U43_C08F27830 [Asparagus officinalis]
MPLPRPLSLTMHQDQSRRNLITYATGISLALILLTTTMSFTRPHPKNLAQPQLHHSSHTSTTISTCQATLYPSLCQSSLSSASQKTLKKPKEAFALSVRFSMDQARSLRDNAADLTRCSAVDDCLELIDITLEQLTDVLNHDKASDPHSVDTWLSAAMTNQATCMDSLQEGARSKDLDWMSSDVHKLSQCISNSLALHQTVKKFEKHKKVSGGSRIPGWMTIRDRNLLEASADRINADAVVAKDGSGAYGAYRSIGDALMSVPRGGGGGRTVIYVKAGVYEENVNITTEQKNVMLMGDGKGKTVIVGRRSVAAGWTTYRSATVAAMGSGFIAKGLTIINNSGSQAQQAVALRVGADLSVIYQCSIEGYQDTLYAHSNRQFYRDNDIYGTVDFIFGNAAAVLQKCFIHPMKRSDAQHITITAQGRRDPHQNTGLSFHQCSIVASSNVCRGQTYLGRPWHKYSRTVYMESYLDASISPEGWLPWAGSFGLSTLYYGEYGNRGAGSDISGRVKWPGVHSSLNYLEASSFTVGQFISGDAWLPGTGVQYDSGL